MIVGVPRSTYSYKAKPKDDAPVQEVLTALTDKHADIGFWQSYHRIRNKGHKWNHKKLYRIYTERFRLFNVIDDFNREYPFNTV